ncbi:MAG: sigma-70 family RNA polymerase sigma factor [Saprospiraceae bacterium]|nr:sigma-70 family RNA polymerase sigma factor [Saprospiraceae bacterium]
MVYTLSVKMLKRPEEAEEAAQDTFVKVYQSLNKFKGESKFSTWIYKVNYNTCLDRIKKYKKEHEAIPLDDWSESKMEAIGNVLDSISEKERTDTIQDCIRLLPEEDGFLLTLFYFEEQSLEEISKIIGITPNYVKVRLFRSKIKLTSILKNRLEPEILEYYESERR